MTNTRLIHKSLIRFLLVLDNSIDLLFLLKIYILHLSRRKTKEILILEITISALLCISIVKLIREVFI